GADPVSDGERVSSCPVILSDTLRTGDNLHDPLELLKGQESQRKAIQGGYTSIPPSQPIEEEREHGESEIRFRLSSPSGKPDDIRCLPLIGSCECGFLPTHDRRQHRYDEDDLKEPPPIAPGASEKPKRGVHQGEGAESQG